MITPHAFPDAWRRGVYEAIARRRDMRHFLPDLIPPEVLARILGAGHQAGSVGFSQPWNFVLVQDAAQRQRVYAHVEEERLRAAEAFSPERRAQYLSFKLEGIRESPLNILVTCDHSRFGPAVIGRNTIPESDVYSTCGAVQNLWLAARAEGVGMGWVSILKPEMLQQEFALPAHVVPVAYLCMGYVESFPEKSTLQSAGWLPRLPLQDVVFFNHWGEAPPEDLRACLNQTQKRSAEGRAPTGTGVDPVRKSDKHHGLLMIYTGKGKGKTTAALGMVFRALGRNLNTAVVQFIKGKWKTGERLFAQSLPQLTFLVMGEGFTWESDDISRDKAAAQAAWAKARELILGGEQALVVLDEITYAINYGFIELEDVARVLQERPAHVHVVLTGRNAPPILCEQADLVTDMVCIKHPYAKDIPAQIGVDF